MISEIDRFDASWQAVERREGQSLKELKSIATVRSVGASTRIEGSKLSDEEVDILLKNMDGKRNGILVHAIIDTRWLAGLNTIK
jgi:hypothetical protein